MISLLVVGNLVGFVLITLYRSVHEQGQPYRQFAAAKILQCLGWLLLDFRGVINDLISVYIGNTLLMTGFALEAFSLITVGRQEKGWGVPYLAITVAAVAAFWILGSTPNMLVAWASLATITLFLPASAALAFGRGSSVMRRMIGILYGIACAALALRAWQGFFAASGFGLMSRSLIQSASFTTLFVVLVVSGSGFLLLLKEHGDERINESEKKYRTLVERANEAICIIQDQKVVFANKTTERLVGAPLKDILGRLFTDFLFPPDMEGVASNYSNRIEGEDVPETYTFRLQNEAGEPVWVLTSATTIDYGGRRAILALMTNINSLKLMEKELETAIEELRKAFARVKTLSGLLPICSSCKKIRNDKGYWEQMEIYIRDHSEADFSHGLCPECAERLYPGFYKKK